MGAAIDRLDRAVADEPVRHVLSVLVHGEDTCLSIFEAPDPGAIERVAERAGFPLDRIVEATAYPGRSHRPAVGSAAQPGALTASAGSGRAPASSHQPSGSARAASTTPSRSPCGLTRVEASP